MLKNNNKKTKNIHFNLCLFFASILFLSVSASAKEDLSVLLLDIQSGRISVNEQLDAKFRQTPLMIAAGNNGDLELTKSLLSMGANPNQREATDFTALMFASLQEDGFGIIQELLNYGADPNMENINGQTALIFASSMGYIDNIDILLARGARHDYINKHGKIALFYASKEGRIDAVKKLLEPRYDNQETIKYISDAIGVARHYKHMNCVDILRQYKSTITVK